MRNEKPFPKKVYLGLALVLFGSFFPSFLYNTLEYLKENLSPSYAPELTVWFELHYMTNWRITLLSIAIIIIGIIVTYQGACQLDREEKH